MTFYEAALEVLRRSKRPLHYKKITEVAVEESLLSHVGKTPDMTMRARLNQEVKKEDHSALVRTRPGVFGLREEVAERLEREAREKQEAEERERRERESSKRERQQREAQDRLRREEEEKKKREAAERKKREEEEARKKKQQQKKEEDQKSNGRSSRRRGRGSRGGQDRNNKKSNGRARARGTREEVEPEPAPEPSASRGASSRGSAPSSNGAPVELPSTDEEVSLEDIDQKHLDHGPVRLEGIAEAAHTVLGDNDQAPMPIAELADEIFNRKLVRFHTHDAAMTVQAAIVNDNQLRERRGHRPLFVRYTGERWGLSEWGMTADALRKEQQILSLSEECRQEALGHLGAALLAVSPEALEQVTLTMLEGRGYRNIKVSKRSSNGDVFFSADWRQGLSDVRVCIQLVGDNDTELASEAVTDLRGTLHHYAASEGVIIHFGDISKKAIEESREPKLAPITLIDRRTFVELLVDQGIGIRRYHTPILVVDTGYIDELIEG